MWTLGILLGLVQLAVPVVSVVWIVIVILKAAFSGPDVEVANAAWHQGRVWIPQRHSEEGEGGKKERRWHLLQIGEAGHKTVPLPDPLATGSTPRLVASGKELWVLSSQKRGKLQGEAVVLAEEGQRLDAASRPFVLNGSPALLKRDDRRLSLLRLSGSKWSDAGSIGLEVPESEYPDDMVVVPVGELLHVFMETSDDDVMVGVGKVGGDAGGRSRRSPPLTTGSRPAGPTASSGWRG